ncbi:hypothetical protein [Rhodococcoides fascians]|uniref:hypothetical protein n=1 Tax=Rhodococcoides fascians TaxID=1828 RepID=UPI00056929C6|nr:hypothetical protein [Rhodococcus fascians]
MRINTARDEIFAALSGAGLTVQGWEQKQINPPVAIVVPAEPFLDGEGDVSFADPFAVHYVIQLIAGRGTAGVVQDQCADMIEKATLALTGIGMSLDSAEYPLIGEEQDPPTIGAQLRVSAAINLKEDV